MIEPKADFKKRLTYSPDTAEAFMLTFAPTDTLPEVMVI